MAKKNDPKELLGRAQDALAKAEETLQKSFNKASKEFSQRLAEVFGDTKELRQGLEDKVEQGTEAFWSALGLATKSELADAQRKLTQLQKRVKELEGTKPSPRRAEA